MHRIALVSCAALAVLIGVAAAPAARAAAVTGRTRQLILVSHPVGATATLTAYARRRRPGRHGASGPWRRIDGPWPAEIGRTGVRVQRHEGDGATPLGRFTIGPELYGNAPRPTGLHARYVRLRCGDWWDEDPASAAYNRFVALPCGVRPSFGGDSEALWTEAVAYPYFAVIDFNVDPIRRAGGSDLAPGSGIFLHSWVSAATDGCVAVHRTELLRLLRWLRPADHPVIDITRAAGPLAAGLPAAAMR